MRILASLLVFKFPQLCSYALYLEFAISLVTTFMPVDVPVEREVMYLIMNVTITFLLTYSNWRLDICLSMVTIVPFFASRSAFS